MKIYIIYDKLLNIYIYIYNYYTKMKIKYLKEKYKYISVLNMNYKNIRIIRIYSNSFFARNYI